MWIYFFKTPFPLRLFSRLLAIIYYVVCQSLILMHFYSFPIRSWDILVKSCEELHWRAVRSNFSLILFQQRNLQIHRIFMNISFFFCLTSAPIALSVRNSSFPKHSICFSTLHLPMQFPLAQILFIFWPLASKEQDVSILLLF